MATKMVTKQSKENEVYMKKTTLEEKLGYNQKGAKKEPKKGAEIRQNILCQMEENPKITQVKLMEEFELTRKQVQKIIKDLQKEGLIERQGSNRSGRWVVRK